MKGQIYKRKNMIKRKISRYRENKNKNNGATTYDNSTNTKL